jgi:hypothetical protein
MASRKICLERRELQQLAVREAQMTATAGNQRLRGRNGSLGR